MRFKSYFVLLLLLMVFEGNAQVDRLKFERISVEEGLSQSSAFAIAQDSLGYIWIGTYDGLNRYSGYDIKVYKHDPNNQNSLADNYIQALCVGDDGRLWVGTNSQGICVFDPASNDFEQFPIKEKESDWGLDGLSILSLKRLDKNRLIALTENGISLIDVNSFKAESITKLDLAAFENTPSLISYFNKIEIDESTINCTLTDSRGEFWVGTETGLRRIRSDLGLFIEYTSDPYDPFSISADDITCIMEDRGGVIWVGTSLGGVCRWDRLNEGMLLYRNNPNDESSPNGSKIRCFYEDSKERIWVGTVENGLNLWNRETDGFVHWNINSGAGLNNNHIRDIVEWQGKYVVAMDGGGVQSFDAPPDQVRFKNINVEGLPQDARVWDLFTDGSSLWIASYDYGLFQLKDDSSIHYTNGIETENITWVSSDDQGRIWVATFGNGLYRMTPRGFDNWNSSNSALSDDRIYSIVVGDADNLWLGTKGGLNEFSIAKESFTVYTTRDGLPNGTVMGIVPCKDSGLWLTTNRGVSHFYPPGDRITNYDISDGLQNNEFLVHSFLELRSGEILFGGINGFNVFPVGGLSLNPYPPQIVITDFIVAADDWHTDSTAVSKRSIELEHYQNEFTFEFAALGYADAAKNTYAYMMEGFDKDWKMIGTRRFAHYTNMPPGEYVFMVKAANNDGVWNENPISVRVVIYPAFWQTLWFKIVVAICAALILLLIYRLRVRQIEKKNKWLESEVTARTKEVNEQKEEIQEKNHMIEAALTDINDSIKYAKRIQNAILPTDEKVKEYLKDSFVLYKPKDQIAGDFYWMEKKDGKVLFAAADCTGHGVPGAMVSVVCNNALNRSVREHGLIETGKILDKTREIVIEEFENSADEVKDGMDIALCSLDGNKLEYSGAHNPLWIIRKGEILETKANKQPIGKFDNPIPYTTHSFELEKGDSIYIFSDGYVDQFGGVRGKKFKAKSFRDLLLRIQDKPMAEQQELINEAFEEWRGDLEQIDDVCVIGVRF
ncbi:SpoIIE family protein phosphatase, partial [bacterium AH-315-C20]|nr:SpoIIE family protein phosphatase [bacterium AH-315-C20]